MHAREKRRCASHSLQDSEQGGVHAAKSVRLLWNRPPVWDPNTVISHDSVTITTFSILPRANELLRVPQPVFPDRTGIGSIPAKRFLRLPQLTRYFIVPKSAKSRGFSSTMQNQLFVYSDTSPRASPVARDFFPRLRRCAGSDPAASDPRISLHPGLVRSAPREASAAPQNAIFH